MMTGRRLLAAVLSLTLAGCGGGQVAPEEGPDHRPLSGSDAGPNTSDQGSPELSSPARTPEPVVTPKAVEAPAPSSSEPAVEAAPVAAEETAEPAPAPKPKPKPKAKKKKKAKAKKKPAPKPAAEPEPAPVEAAPVDSPVN